MSSAVEVAAATWAASEVEAGSRVWKPIVVLLGRTAAQPHGGRGNPEDRDHVGAAAQLAVEPLLDSPRLAAVSERGEFLWSVVDFAVVCHKTPLSEQERHG